MLRGLFSLAAIACHDENPRHKAAANVLMNEASFAPEHDYCENAKNDQHGEENTHIKTDQIGVYRGTEVSFHTPVLEETQTLYWGGVKYQSPSLMIIYREKSS
mmetsp:Transcript_7661/g.7568  ORF Transcript_7661/g.7568 Transcript_7661/m.7568 type:complete len:103 (-) Transcript_7661:105-413(-)